MPASDYPYFSKEAAIACGIGATLALIIAAMVIIGLRNHETPSHKLDGATVEAANQVDISTASQAPDEEGATALAKPRPAFRPIAEVAVLTRAPSPAHAPFHDWRSRDRHYQVSAPRYQTSITAILWGYFYENSLEKHTNELHALRTRLDRNEENFLTLRIWSAWALIAATMTLGVLIRVKLLLNPTLTAKAEQTDVDLNTRSLASQTTHDNSTFNPEIRVRPQAAFGSTLSIPRKSPGRLASKG